LRAVPANLCPQPVPFPGTGTALFFQNRYAEISISVFNQNQRRKPMTTKWKAKPRQQKPLRQRVEAKFLKFMESFRVTEYREVRTILRELLAVAEK
jgi:hypothetical protein